MPAQSDAQNVADTLRLLESALNVTPPNLNECRRLASGLHASLDRGLLVYGPTLGLTPQQISAIRGGGTGKTPA